MGYSESSWRKINSLDGLVHLVGLSIDLSSLPKKSDLCSLSTGADALTVDTAKFYKYEETTDTWYPFPPES